MGDFHIDRHLPHRLWAHIKCLFGKHYGPMPSSRGIICWCCGKKLKEEMYK